jgi:tRNA pseudouridine32 synthase/23S rRNA pseudouridine746 synthase
LTPRPLQYNPPQDPLNVLHQDDALLVLSKPSGLLSVPGKAENHADSLETRAKAQFPGALLIHRLDLETSGVFIMAMNKDAQANLGKQFERRKTEKTYIARVWGTPDQDTGHIDLPLRCDWENRPRQMVCHEHGKPAQTAWKVLERAENITRLELTPHTGRSHQLRVHLAEIGHPILGDPFYAPEDVYDAADRLQLHALSLTVYHPQNGELTTFTDPCPF